MSLLDRRSFLNLATRGNSIPLVRRLMSDQLTPVLGYRRLVAPDQRTAPSFLLESVEGGSSVGRFSFIGAQPAMEIVAHGHEVEITDHRRGSVRSETCENPFLLLRSIGLEWRFAEPPSTAINGHPAFTGGWVGYSGYDTVRYLEPRKLPFASAPRDDRNLPDLHFAFYRQIGVFDHVSKVLYAIQHVRTDEHDSADAAYDSGCRELDEFVNRLSTHSVPLPAGEVDLDLARARDGSLHGNFTRGDFENAVRSCKEYIAAGDVFQVVLSQRFERRTEADPFETYRALRIVNPSPYMIYLQARDSILIASSPEILCRCRQGVVVNRPLAGTRRRGLSHDEDLALERELLTDEKERAEHVMLVDLGRNDLGRVCEKGSISLGEVMVIERFSHVMHLSSTVIGRLRAGLDCWDALQGTLPVGTVSGAPKIRAMQIIDELEPTRRGPYAGGIGYVSLEGDMDMAIALRTMVIPARDWQGGPWSVHLQAGAGIVADSDPGREFVETVNKAAALNRAIDLAETAFRIRR